MGKQGLLPKVIYTRVTVSLHTHMRKVCEFQKKKFNDFVTEAILEKLEREKNEIPITDDVGRNPE